MALFRPAGLSVPNAQKSLKVVEVLCKLGGYQPLIDGLPNPQTDQEFAQWFMDELWKGTIIDLVRADIRRAAADSADADLTAP